MEQRLFLGERLLRECSAAQHGTAPDYGTRRRILSAH
jgi:hypothetical protein